MKIEKLVLSQDCWPEPVNGRWNDLQRQEHWGRCQWEAAKDPFGPAVTEIFSDIQVERPSRQSMGRRNLGSKYGSRNTIKWMQIEAMVWMSLPRKVVDTRQERDQVITQSNTNISNGERGGSSQQQTPVFISG